jgi:hypothetical protein
MSETAAVLENEIGICAGRRFYGVPVNGVVQINVKICDYRAAIDSHICRRRRERLFNVLHLFDERLLRRAARAGTQLYRSFIHHDGEGEARMLFDFRHYRQRGFVGECISESIPVDDHTINAAADHVRDLTVNLRWILRVVTHIHMTWIAKPGHQMRYDFAARARIQKSMNIQLAGISGAHISVALRLKSIRRAGIVRSFRLEGGGRNYFKVSGC